MNVPMTKVFMTVSIALSTAVLAFSLAAAPTVSANASAETVTVRLRQAVKNLPVATETRAGYDRDKFNHWIDADGDCRDTRDEVLAIESLVTVDGCDIQAGKWRSYYDGDVTRDSTNFDVDHLVALAEAWDSGAKRWTAGTRKRFANDLGDGRSLVAVSASSNRSKSDQDPAEWMPQLGKCKYITQWVAVKIRWRLKVDGAEKRFLAQKASGCRNVVIKVRRARNMAGTATPTATASFASPDPDEAPRGEGRKPGVRRDDARRTPDLVSVSVRTPSRGH